MRRRMDLRTQWPALKSLDLEAQAEAAPRCRQQLSLSIRAGRFNSHLVAVSRAECIVVIATAVHARCRPRVLHGTDQRPVLCWGPIQPKLPGNSLATAVIRHHGGTMAQR